MTEPDGQAQHEATLKRWRKTKQDNGAFILVKIGFGVSAAFAVLKTLGVAPMPWLLVCAPAAVALLLGLGGVVGGLARFSDDEDRDGGQARQERTRLRARKALREMSRESEKRRSQEPDTWGRSSR